MATATFLPTILIVSLLLVLPYAVYGGSSGLDFISRATLPDSAPEDTVYCAGPTWHYNTFVVQCPASTLLFNTFGSFGTIRQVVKASYGLGGSYSSSSSCPNSIPGNSDCGCDVTTRTGELCVGIDYCAFRPDSRISCNLCYGTEAMIASYRCASWRRTITWAVTQASPGSPVYWSTSRGIYAVAGNAAPNSNPVLLVNFNNAAIGGMTYLYVNSWTFNGRMYIFIGRVATEGRLYEIPTIPTAPIQLNTDTIANGGHETAVIPISFTFRAVAHSPLAGDANGIIFAAELEAVRAWRRESGVWTLKGTWDAPETCSGQRCFDFVSGASLVIPVPINGKNYVAFGATSGRIVLLDITDETFFRPVEVLLAGAGSVLAIAYGEVNSRPYLFYGTSLGLVFQFDLVDRRIANLAAISIPDAFSVQIQSVVFDAATRGLFVGGGDNIYASFVARITVTPFELRVFDTEVLTNVTSGGNQHWIGGVRALLLDVPRNRLYLGVDQPISKTPLTVPWTETVPIVEYRMAACAQYSCSSCGVDDSNFCGWCPGTHSCTLIPSVTTGSCPTIEGPFSQPALCPTITSMSKTSGTSGGGSTVAFNGVGFYAGAGAASRYSCLFGSNPGVVSAVSANAIFCTTPPGTVGSVTVTIRYLTTNLIPSNGTLTFTYFDCGSLSCSTCFTDGAGDCVWCHVKGACTAPSACSGSSSTTQCPIVNSVSNPISTTGPTGNFSIQASILPAGTYRCVIGSQRSAGSISGSSSVNCARPAGIAAQTTAPYLEVLDGAQWNRFTQPRGTDPLLEVYNCSAIGACFPCINNHPDCTFCSTTGCGYNAPSAQCSATTAGCPKIDATVPARLHYSGDAGAALLATISAPGTVDPATYRCVWTRNTGVLISNLAPINATTTAVYCPVPAGNLTMPNVGLEIFTATTPLTNKFSVAIYDCTAGTRCTTCTDPSRPRCAWCNSLLLCEAPTALPGGSCPGAISGCPTMTAVPNQEPTAGGRTIVVTPTPYPVGAQSALCTFTGPNGFVSDTAATSDGSSFRCVAPPAPAAFTGQLSLRVAETEYATPVPFTYFDCAFSAPNVPRTCADCVTRSGCGWCGASCAPAVGGCNTPLTTCPVIRSVSPLAVDAENPEFIAVVTDPLPPSEFAYECAFAAGSQRVAASSTPTGLRCQTPRLSFAGPVDVKIAVRGNSIGFWSTDATSPEVQFYRCSSSTRQCGTQCFSSSPSCGYCLETGLCTGKAACERAISASDSGLLIDNSWFNETRGCPSVGSISPSYVQAALPNRPVIREKVTFTVSGLSLPSVNTTKRSVSLNEFTCRFGSDVSTADSYNPQTNTFTCPIPVLNDQGFYSVTVELRSNRINGDNAPRLQVQDCFNIPACGLCLLQPNCGWCRGSVKCMTKAWCDAEPISDFGAQCPTLTRVSPATALISGDVPVTITGGPFVNSSALFARLDYPDNTTVALATTWVDQNTLSVVIPRATNDREGEVKMVVFINGTSYTPSELTFTYLAPSGIAGGVSSGAIGGIIAAAVLVILILIAILLIMRTRKVGFFSQFKLKEPDYSLIAFGTMLQPQWKAPKDNWEILAIKLLSKDHSFVLSILATTPPTEQDKIARALCHIYEWHKKSVDYGVLFVTDEVKRNLEENTIFRNNSMASKWFKFYSKIIGIKYLFDHLARFIYELNKISEIKSSSTEDTTGGKSLLSLEMEVDPNKFGNDAFTDSEANVYQLILACQKVFTAFRTSIDKIPSEFKEVFASMRESIVNKFKSEDAVLKAVGGFFFLRFSCPAITAPHAYGLLENPPNESCQRQLVLIGKVIQNLANMTMPGAKEEFMQQLNDFFARNIPKMRQFYNELLTSAAGGDETSIVTTPDVARTNGLGFIMEHIHLQNAKLRQHFDLECETESGVAELNATLKELLELYPKKPRKFVDKDKDDN